MTLLGPPSWCCYAKRNGSEPSVLNFKYYFIAHHEYTEASSSLPPQTSAAAAADVRTEPLFSLEGKKTPTKPKP